MLTAKDMYERGSEQCRQYSMLTMQVRTMAQHILIAYAIGIGLVLSRVADKELSVLHIQLIIVGFSGALIVFASVLWLLNHHHSRAFVRIRDEVLVKLEQESGVFGPKRPIQGPWSAHQWERRNYRLCGVVKAGRLPWNAPFIALILFGIAGVIAGLVYVPRLG